MGAMEGYGSGASGMMRAVSPQAVKFAQSLSKMQPPPQFAAMLRVDKDAGQRIGTHFGEVVMLIEKKTDLGIETEKLSGFWKVDGDGNLSQVPEEAIPELIESMVFSSHLVETQLSRKHVLFERMAKAKPLPSDMQTYNSDKERKRTFLFSIGDGREIVVFANDGKTELLRAAVIKSGPFGMKSIAPLPTELYGSLFEQASISAALDEMAAAKPQENSVQYSQSISRQQMPMPPAPSGMMASQPASSGAPFAKPAMKPSMAPPIPPMARKSEVVEMGVPRMPAAKWQAPAYLQKEEEEPGFEHPTGAKKPPLENILRKTAEATPEEERFLRQVEEKMTQKESKIVPKQKGKKPEVRKKGAKQLEEPSEEMESEEEYAPTPAKQKGGSFKPIGMPQGHVRGEIASMNPYDAQQKIINMLEELHLQRLQADKEREKAVKALSARIAALEKAIGAYGTELAEYEDGFNKRRENLESALRGWEKYGSEISEYKKRVDELTDTAAEISGAVGQMEMPSEKEAEWAKGLADSLVTLKEVSNRLAEAERKHKEEVEKMSEQLQKSFSKSIGGAGKRQV